MRLLGLFSKKFMERFWTTSGHTIFVPSRYDNDPDWGYADWQERHSTLIDHELTHIQQYERLGAILYTFLYLFPPCLFAWGRWRLEREAYLVNIQRAPKSERLYVIERIVESLWTNYFWTWPKSWMRKWFQEHGDVE